MAAIPRNQDLIRELFDRALERPAGERVAFVDEACRGNVDLRAELTSLLKLHEEAGSALRDPSGPVSEQPGERIGHYRLLQRIGEGGFGTVWMAEQQEPVRRKVALKVLKAGMDTAQVVARFEAERQALALMDHPHIAQVFDGGSTPGGRPYFVMELVRGVPITRYCDEAGLSPRERLELFIPVCQAVQHAHFKGVIHRDIKPTNVLVTLHDGRPVPKVIDFGIAKAVQGRLTERTLFTEFQQMLGTPEYMAPEQAEMSALDVDTRADVYSLGVLLYELLTGTRPFDFRTLLDAGYAEVLRTIKEVDPPKPSTRVSTLGEQLASVAKQRRMHPRALGPLMRGDLDWIVMRTLEKERNRRYATPAALAEDVQRYLRDEPVEAGPPSRLYRWRKYVQRHRLGVTSGAAIALAVCAGSAAAGWGWLRASDEALAARIQAGKVARLVELHEEMIGSSDPKHFHGPDYTVRQMLEEYEAELGGDLAGEPEVEIQLRRMMARSFLGLGLLERATAQLGRIRELRAMLPEGSAVPTPEDLLLEAYVLSNAGRWNEALLIVEPLVERSRATGGSEKTLAAALKTLSTCLLNLGQREQARLGRREVLEIQRRLGDADGVVHAMLDLADNDRLTGRLDDADQAYREIAALVEKGGHFPCVELHFQLGYAELLEETFREKEAVQLAEKALAKSRELYGDSSQDTAEALHTAGSALFAVGEYGAASSRFEEAWRIRSRLLGETHPATAFSRIHLALASTDSAAAERHARQAVEADRLAGRERSVMGADRLTILAGILSTHGRHDEAEQALADALVVYRSHLDERDRSILAARFVLARIARGRGALEEAERLLLQLLPDVASDDQRLAEAEQDLGLVMRAKGDQAQAVVHFERSLSALGRIGGQGSGMAGWNLHHLADARWNLGERDEALRLLAEARALFTELRGPDDPAVAEAAECSARMLSSIGKLAEAESSLREALRIRIARSQPEECAKVWRQLGNLLLDHRKDREGAEREYNAGIEHLRGAGGLESSLGADLLVTLGFVRMSRRDMEGAEPCFREALDVFARIGADPSATKKARVFLTTALEERGDWFSAEEQRRELVAIHRVLRREGAADEKLASTLEGLATNLVRQGRDADAEPVLREALELERADADPVSVAAALVRLGACLLELQRAAEAVPLLEEGLALRSAHTPDDWRRYDAASLLGAAYLACNERERAEPLLVEAASKIEPPVSLASRRRDAIERLIALYEASARPEDAATWRRTLDELPAR